MGNYFDNQSNWEWHNSNGSIQVYTDHGTHTHTLDLTNIPIGAMIDNPGQTIGDAHRAASHDFKDEADLENAVPTVTEDTMTNTDATNTVQTEVEADQGNTNDLDDGEDCDDGLDL